LEQELEAIVVRLEPVLRTRFLPWLQPGPPEERPIAAAAGAAAAAALAASGLVACGSSGSGGTAFPALYNRKAPAKLVRPGAWPCPKNNAGGVVVW
jgi:hypothetical protein